MPAHTSKFDGNFTVHHDTVQMSAINNRQDYPRHARAKRPYPRPAANTRATFSNGRAMKNDRMIACS